MLGSRSSYETVRDVSSRLPFARSASLRMKFAWATPSLAASRLPLTRALTYLANPRMLVSQPQSGGRATFFRRYAAEERVVNRSWIRQGETPPKAVVHADFSVQRPCSRYEQDIPSRMPHCC